MMKGRGKREPQIRYVYTHEPGSNAPPVKTAVIKKMMQRAPPKDLITMLVEKKQSMYAKEQKLTQIRDREDKNYRESVAEYNSSEEEDDEENYAWYKDKDPDNYFTLCTRTKNCIEKDQQVYVCYGRRSNRYLLSAYGFCLQKNKYNALTFRVWLDFRDKQEEAKRKAAEDEESEDEEDNRISKVLKLKNNRLKDDLLAYIRMSLIQKNEKDTGEKVKENILISTPVDIEFEMLTLGCAIHLLQQLLSSRFRGVTVEQDREELARSDLPWRRRCALMHRLHCKEILTSNINLCNVLMRILANLQVELAKGQTQFTKLECKRLYMAKVEPFEKTDDEVMLNRIRFRNYIRELILNQERMMEKIAQKEVGE